MTIEDPTPEGETAAPKKVVYEGRVYVRPVQRGVSLMDAEEDWQDVGDWLSHAIGEDPYWGGRSGGTRVRITVEVLEP